MIILLIFIPIIPIRINIFYSKQVPYYIHIIISISNINYLLISMSSNLLFERFQKIGNFIDIICIMLIISIQFFFLYFILYLLIYLLNINILFLRIQEKFK